jgi:UPF0716 protein FxsA
MLMIRIIRNWGLCFVLLELVIFILMVKAIGFWATLFLIVLSGLIGVFLLRLAGIYNLATMQNGFSVISIPSPEDSGKSMVLMIAGFLFLLPGFITSFLAILCLLPFIGPLFSSKLVVWGRKSRKGGMGEQDNTGNPRIIEGEFRREDPK